MLFIHLVRYLLEYVLPMRDILVLDEPMRKASLCCQKHKEDQLLSDMESGKLMSDDAVSSLLFFFFLFFFFFFSFFSFFIATREITEIKVSILCCFFFNYSGSNALKFDRNQKLIIRKAKNYKN